MKKFLSVLLVISMVALFAVPIAAAPDGESYGDVKKVNDGDIKLDGFRDEPAWENAVVIQVNRISPTSPNTDRPGATGTVYALWSDKGLYLFGEVTDPTPTHTPLDEKLDKSNWNWNTDSMEIFIDMGNTGEQPNIQHNKVDIDGLGYIYIADGGEQFIGTDEVKPYMEYAGRQDGNTYYLEVLIHVPGTSYKAGDQIGIQIQINDMTVPDMTDAADRVVILSTNSFDADSWEVDRHNYIVLSAEDANPPPPPPAPPAEEPAAPAGGDEAADAEAAPAATAEPPAPSVRTGDGAMIIFAIMILAAGAFVRNKVKNLTMR